MDLVARVWMSCVDLVAVSLFIGSCCVGVIVWILCAWILLRESCCVDLIACILLLGDVVDAA